MQCFYKYCRSETLAPGVPDRFLQVDHSVQDHDADCSCHIAFGNPFFFYSSMFEMDRSADSGRHCPVAVPTRHHDKYVIPPCIGPVLGTLNDSSSLKNKSKNLSALTASLHAAGTLSFNNQLLIQKHGFITSKLM